jgi:glutaminyl-tRNA synthetase
MELGYLESIGIPVPNSGFRLTARGKTAFCTPKAAQIAPAANQGKPSPSRAASARSPAAASEAPPSGGTARNFLEQKIDADLAPGGRCDGRLSRKGDVIRTRFPPEPNGYLHIGHAKSICTNFGLALKYNGRCHLRFDDTNPAAEETEYVESIQEDVKWLGFDWGEHLCFASNYFDQYYEWAEYLIKNGKAYVDSQTPEDMKKNRGNVNTPGVDSPFRNRKVEENLKLFREMKAGKYKEGEHVLRAKTDMKHPNMMMRDLPIYRILHKPHHRTGSKWCIYPLYDFAHGQGDSIEGITHSICTLEFEGHRIFYDWCTENLPIEDPPKQTEFARLNLTNTVMSKRKLLKLVKEKAVEGWDDPRMPTLCGMRRRGVTPEALRKFCEKIGITNRNSMLPVDLLEETIREDLDPKCHRRMVVLKPLKLTIVDYPKDKVEEVETANHPVKPEEGTRKMKFCQEVWIEQDDFREDAPESYFRLKPGGEAKLRNSYVVKVKEVVKNKAGDVVEIRCTHDPATRDCMPSDRKVKGVIHWVSARHCFQPKAIRMYDYLLRSGTAGEEVAPAEAAEEEEEDDKADHAFMKELNPKSKVVIGDAKMEESLKSAKPFERFQFERNGYFVVDKETDKPGAVWNSIVGLNVSGLAKEEDAKAAGRSRKEDQAKQAAEKEAKKKIDPRMMFKGQTDLYSQFDEDGVPTHDASGEALPKKRVKKLREEWEKQRKLFEK